MKRYIFDIGQLDRTIEIESLVNAATTTNELGHKVTEKYFLKKVYASVKYQNRDEDDELGKQTQIQYLEFMIRFIDIKLTDKIIFECNKYDIVNVEEVGRKQFIKVTTKRIF